MKSPLLALSLFLPVALLSAQSPQQTQPVTPPDLQRNQAPASCPIRVDEAYMTSDPAAMPTEGGTAKRTLHVTLVDAGGKEIVGYLMHARIGLQPNRDLNKVVDTGMVTRAWKGNLPIDTPTKAQWNVPADRFTLNLRRVWFDKVMFADGTMWNKTAGDGCIYAATGHVVQTRAHTSVPAK